MRKIEIVLKGRRHPPTDLTSRRRPPSQTTTGALLCYYFATSELQLDSATGSRFREATVTDSISGSHWEEIQVFEFHGEVPADDGWAVLVWDEVSLTDRWVPFTFTEAGSDGSDSGSGSDDTSEGSGDPSGSGSGDGSGGSGGTGDGSGGTAGTGDGSGDGSGGTGGSGSGSGSGTGGTGGTGNGTGGTGGTGNGSGKDTAIVPASWSSKGYAALFVLEAPEVRFDDVIVIEMPQQNAVVALDPKFVEVCEPGSIEVCGSSVNQPVLLGATVDGGLIDVKFAERHPDRMLRVVIRLTGIRKGFAGMRFPERSKAQFESNERFIRSAYNEE